MASEFAEEDNFQNMLSPTSDDEENWLENYQDNNSSDFGDFSEILGMTKPTGIKGGNDGRKAEKNLGQKDMVASKSSEKPVQRMALNDHKAGMQGLDKEKINSIIFEASKGSKFYENERKKERRVAEKISLLKEEFSTFTTEDFKRAKKTANAYLTEIEKERDLSRVIVHIDMDAFYAAVETRDDPSLKDIPMAVGSTSMLSTSNYAARKYGVRAAMPGFIAKKLCPHLKIVSLHPDKYRSVSNDVRKILGAYDPNFCGVGLDEAYLDLTEYVDIKEGKRRSMQDCFPQKLDTREVNSLTADCDMVSKDNVGIETDSNFERENFDDITRSERCQEESHGSHGAFEIMCFSSEKKYENEEGLSCKKIEIGSDEVMTHSYCEEKLNNKDGTFNNEGYINDGELDYHEPDRFYDQGFDNNKCEVDDKSCSFRQAESTPINDQIETNLKQTAVERIVNEIRAKICKETKLTASAGIAPNIMLAKVCSDMNKPNGQFYLPPDKKEIMKFIADLPIRKVSGIGRVCEQILNTFGIESCKELYEKRALLNLLFSPISFQHFMRISQGISETILDNDTERKSMSTETTFSDTSNPDELYHICEELCETLSFDLQKEKLAGRSISLKLKLANFEVKTRSKTINQFVSSKEDIWQVAKIILRNEILAVMPEKLNLRLMGVRMSEFGREEKHGSKLEDLFKKSKAAKRRPKEDITDSSFLESAEKEKEQTKPKVSCPICSKQFDGTDINSHIDSCLNKQTIKELLQQDKNFPAGNSLTSTTTLPNIGCKKLKSTKRKSLEDTPYNAPSKKKTLMNFWDSAGRKST